MKVTRSELNECIKCALKQLLKEASFDTDDDMDFNPEGNEEDQVVDRALNPEKYAKLGKNKDPKTGKKKKELSKELKMARKAANIGIDDEVRSNEKDDAALQSAEKSEMDTSDLEDDGAIDYSEIGSEEDASSKYLRDKYGLDNESIFELPTKKLSEIKAGLDQSIGNGNSTRFSKLYRAINNEIMQRNRILYGIAEAMYDGEEVPAIDYGYKEIDDIIPFKYKGKVFNLHDIVQTHVTRHNPDAFGTSGFDWNGFKWGAGI